MSDRGSACHRCGAELGESTSQGLCPQCLLWEGLEATEQRTEANDQSPLVTCHSSLLTQFGDYELLGQIARGGMGVVYKARQKSLDRIVALKMLLFGPQASAAFVRRFRTEAVAAASLQHPNIVAIHEVGVHDGQQFFVMDYVDGPSLAQVVGRQPLPVRKAAGYLKIIAEAVHYAHERGILHRDLKPSNVLLDAQDQPRVTDFGLAKRFEEDSQVTATGQVLGSPSYIAPEQAAGKRGRLSCQSDVYALGAMLYHLLTGRPPFQSESVAETLQQVLNREPTAPRLLNPVIPRDLETICLKCLEKEPAHRYATARAVAEELGRFLEDKPIQARPVGAVGRARKWCQRRPALAITGVGLLLSLSLGLGGVLWQWHLTRQIAQAELEQRQRAESGEYAADMRLAQLALAEGNGTFAWSLLEKHRPPRKSQISNFKFQTPGDLRGWEWRYLWQLCQGDERSTFARLPSAVQAIAASRTGGLLAVLASGTVTLWDLDGRRQVGGFATGWPEKALAFSPAEDLLAVGAWGEKGPAVALLETRNHTVIKLLNQEAAVNSLAFSPDGSLLAVLDGNGTAKVLDWKSAEVPLMRLPGSPFRDASAGELAFSPDGNQLAVGDNYGQARLLNVRTGTITPLKTEPGVSVTAIAFASSGNLVAVGYGYSPIIRLSEAQSGDPRGRLTNHTDGVTGLAFMPDGQQLISASWDGTIRIWSVADLAELRRLQSPRERLTGLVMLPDSRTLVTAGSGGSVCFWDADSNVKPSPHSHFQVSPGLESFMGLGAPGFASGSLDPRGVRRSGGAFTPDSRRFLALDCQGSLALRDAQTGRLVENLPTFGSNHWGLALSPDGQWLATGDDVGIVTIWDWKTSRAVTNFALPFEWFGLLGFSTNGHHFFAGCLLNNSTGKLRLWRTAGWSEVPLPGRPPAIPWCVDVSPDERFLAVAYSDGAIHVFRHPSGKLAATFAGHTGPIHSVHFVDNGRALVSTSMDGTARLWDVATRRERAKLEGHLGLVCGGAISPDGRRLATGGSGGDAVKLWDLTAHREILNLAAKGQFFFHLDFSPDGNALVGTSMTGVAHLWHTPSWEEIAASERGEKTR